MIHAQVSLALGIAALYWGFAGILGALLDRARRYPERTGFRGLAVIHGGLICTPASAFILTYTPLPLSIRLMIALVGVAVALLTFNRPGWIPDAVWRWPLTYRYFAGAMLLAVYWGLSAWLSTHSPTSPLVALAACAAGTACLLASPHAS